MTLRHLARPVRLRSAAGAESGRRVTWLELFFDLVFATAVSQVGAPLSEDYSVSSLGRFAFLFLLIWWAWLGHTVFCTRFDTDDAAQRGLTLLQMFAVAVMAVNAKDPLGSLSTAGFAAAYAAMRFILVVQYFRARQVGESRRLTTRFACGYGAAAVLWLGSAFLDAPARWAVWTTALAVDLGTAILAERESVSTPLDAAHLPERFGLFTIILLGESMIAVMQGMEQQDTWSAPAALAAFAGMCVAFFFWWWYFDGVGTPAGERRLRARQRFWLFHLWAYTHFPLYLGIAVTGVGFEHLIAAGGVMAHRSEILLLTGAVGLTMAMLATLGVADVRHSRRERAPLDYLSAPRVPRQARDSLSLSKGASREA
jgi:low temperature requirement protein LtrA